MTMQHFTSLPPEQEASFLVYEQRIENASKSAITLGAIIGGGLGLLVIIISLAVTPSPRGDYSSDSGGTGSKTVKASTVAPSAPPPAEAPPPASGSSTP
jgi:hypothetical protein